MIHNVGAHLPTINRRRGAKELEIGGSGLAGGWGEEGTDEGRREGLVKGVVTGKKE